MLWLQNIGCYLSCYCDYTHWKLFNCHAESLDYRGQSLCDLFEMVLHQTRTKKNWVLNRWSVWCDGWARKQWSTMRCRIGRSSQITLVFLRPPQACAPMIDIGDLCCASSPVNAMASSTLEIVVIFIIARCNCQLF